MRSNTKVIYLFGVLIPLVAQPDILFPHLLPQPLLSSLFAGETWEHLLQLLLTTLALLLWTCAHSTMPAAGCSVPRLGTEDMKSWPWDLCCGTGPVLRMPQAWCRLMYHYLEFFNTFPTRICNFIWSWASQITYLVLHRTPMESNPLTRAANHI